MIYIYSLKRIRARVINQLERLAKRWTLARTDYYSYNRQRSMQMEFKGISMAINDYYFASFNFHCELRILLKLRIFSESRLSAESLAVDGDAVRLTDAVRLLRLLLLET